MGHDAIAVSESCEQFLFDTFGTIKGADCKTDAVGGLARSLRRIHVL
jgi:hypothetical protein